MFEDRVKMLAFRSGLKVKEVSNSRAKLGFEFEKNGRKTIQDCLITPFRDGKYWEFDCLSVITQKVMFEDLYIFLLSQSSPRFAGTSPGALTI